MTLGFIYKITNKLNNKIYIGKTINSIQYRWDQHVSAAFANKDKDEYNFLLHKAIRKYGTSAFEIEAVEEVENEKLSERESYWISFYNSCILEENTNGYNMTYGGEGSLKINRQEIYNLWAEGFGSKFISQKTGHHSVSIKQILQTLSTYSKEEDFARNTGTKVYQYGSDGKLLAEYSSISMAARSVGVDPSTINKCCNGHKKSAAGSYWSYQPDAIFENKELKTWHPYKVLRCSLDGEIIESYASLSEAARAMNKKQPKCIKECCEGKRGSMYGYIWKYE